MARITVEDCLTKVDNRFGPIHLASKRVRQLRKGAEPLVICDNKDIVVALREIADGAIYPTASQENQYSVDENGFAVPEGLPEETSADETTQDAEQETTPEGK